MQRSFVKNILFLLCVNVLIKPVWIFLIDRTVQNRVGHEDYGHYQTLFNLGLILQILLDFGLNNYNNRLIARDPDRLPELFPRMLSARLLLFAFYAAMLLSVALILGYNGWQLAMLSGIMLFQSFTVMLQYIRSNISGLQRFRIDSILSVSDRFFMILIGAVLLFFPPLAARFRIEWFVTAQVFSYGLAMVIAFFILKRIAKVPFSLSFDIREVLPVIKSSFPYAALIFLMSMYTRADAIWIERLVGPGEAGIYASAFRLLDVCNIFPLMFSTILLPLFGRMLSEKKNVVPIIRISVNIMLPVSLSIVTCSYLYGAEIMTLLYDRAGAYDGKVFSWYMFCFPSFCIMYVYSTLLTANGNLRLLITLACAGVLVNFSLNYFLIPSKGALGGGIAACITQSSLAVCYILFAGQRLSLPLHIKWVAAHLGFLALIIPLCYLMTFLPAGWELRIVLSVVACGLLMIPFRFFTVRSLKQLFARN